MFLGHWQFFKSFFNIVFLRYLLVWFALVPVLIKFSSDLPKRLSVFGTQNYLNLTLPFNWKLLWLASLFYFTAFALFHLFCPQFIKRYPSFTDYKTHGHSPRWVIWEFYYAVEGPLMPRNWFAAAWYKIYFLLSPISQTSKLFDRVIIKKYAVKTSLTSLPSPNPNVAENETEAFFTYNSRVYKIACNPSRDDADTKEKEIFWEVFGHFAKQGPAVRNVITVLIALTSMLIAYVLLEHIWSGVSLMLK